MSNSHPFKQHTPAHHIHIFREGLLEYRVCTSAEKWCWKTFLQDGITEHRIFGFVSIIKSASGRPPIIKLYTSKAIIAWNNLIQSHPKKFPMKSTKSLITLLLFTLSFFAMSQTASAESTSRSVNQELASLVQEADDFLAQNKTYSLAEINYPYSWTTDNVTFVTFVSLFSIICLILITSQYVISERNRRPGKVSLSKS
jgi:hypothetical protein